MNSKYAFKVIITNDCIKGHITYENGEILFFPSNRKREKEFSLMIGKGYNDLSISTVNNQVVNFSGYNPENTWINIKLTLPKSQKGELYIKNNLDPIMFGQWYSESWDTYYDKQKNIICLGDYHEDKKDTFIEICTDLIVCLNDELLKSIWIKLF